MGDGVRTATRTRGDVPISVSEPASAPRGGVVVVQEAFGVNHHIEDIGARLAHAGYAAAAPHLFWRAGDPVFAYEDSMDRVLPVMGTLVAEDVLADLDAALAELADLGLATRRCAIVGFCMGGTVAFAAATERDLGAAVTFYGGGVAAGRFGFPPMVARGAHLRAPWLGFYGDEDHGIPVADVEALRASVAAATVPTEVVRYAGAGHGFHCDARSSYHEGSARDAWARTLDWLERHLTG